MLMRLILPLVLSVLVVQSPIGPRPKPDGSKAQVGGNVLPNGSEIHIDLPGELHRHNVSSRGSGCCVFTSIGHSARWQNIDVLIDFQKWIQSKGLAGGGYPGNVKERITAICREKGVPEPAYIQVTGPDLEILKLACQSGRLPAVTYSFSPTGRYGGGRIAHMVSLPHADNEWFTVLDNNYPGADKYEHMDPATFARVYAPGWAVILIDPGPPLPPKNKKE